MVRRVKEERVKERTLIGRDDNMDAERSNGAGSMLVPREVVSTSNLSAEQVFHDYASRVYYVARRMLNNDSDAEDVTQDVLLQVVRKLPTYRGEAALPTWLHRITVNAALSHRRKHAVRQEHGLHTTLTGMGEAQPAPWHADILGPDAEMVLRETRHLIEQAIAGLPPTYRTVFILADVEGLSNAAIGERLGLGLAAVKSRLHRARARMRNILAPYFQERVACPEAGEIKPRGEEDGLAIRPTGESNGTRGLETLAGTRRRGVQSCRA
jgi:RNA polymerase sigma-70 factor (ECF subfamily)